MTSEKRNVAEDVGIAAGGAGSAQNYADNVILGAERGHGFAAEKANHLFDKLSGKDATIIGDDNAKNGADRLVDGVQIQTKYCASGSKCVSECFDESGSLRYWNPDGTPMQIEVPSDKYDDAVKAMTERIRKGQVQGVNDPEKAKEIIRKGNFTYEQARLIAKAGTIESLTYDAASGIKLAGTAAGLSAAITFAMAIWNGEDFDAALEAACYSGLKVGGIAWVSSLITAQLGRTGLEQSLRVSTDWVVKQIGPKAASWIASGLRSGNSIYGAAAMNNVSKLLRGNIVTAAITSLILSTADLYRLFDGRISGAQLFKNVSTTAAGVAGGIGGWQAGAVAGAAVGSFIPIIGTGVGAFIGGLCGGFAGGTAAQNVSKAVLDEIIDDDAKEMSKILERCFVEQAQLYLLGKEEAEKLVDKLKSLDLPDELRNMFASTDRDGFAEDLLNPLIDEVVSSRNIIHLPSDEQLLKGVGKLVDKLAEEDDLAAKNLIMPKILTSLLSEHKSCKEVYITTDISTNHVKQILGNFKRPFYHNNISYDNIYTDKPLLVFFERENHFLILFDNIMLYRIAEVREAITFESLSEVNVMYRVLVMKDIKGNETKWTIYNQDASAILKDVLNKYIEKRKSI